MNYTKKPYIRQIDREISHTRVATGDVGLKTRNEKTGINWDKRRRKIARNNPDSPHANPSWLITVNR